MYCSLCGNELSDDLPFGDNVICSQRGGGCGQLVIPTAEYTEEEEFEEIEVPNCFRFYDDRDKTCTRCPVVEICREAFLERRQPCHARYDSNVVECMYCQMSSHCADDTQKEITSMTKIKVRKQTQRPARKPASKGRKQRPARKPAPVAVVEEIEQEEEELEDEPVDYGKMSISALRKLCVDMELEPGGRKKSDYVKCLMSYDQGEDEELEEELDDDEFEEPEPPVRKPAKRQRPARGKKERPVRKPARKPVPVVEEEPELDELAVADVEDSGPFGELVQMLNMGDSLTFTKLDENTWSVSKGVPVPASVGIASSSGRTKNAMTKKAFQKLAFSDELLEHLWEDAAGTGMGWRELTVEKRYKVAAEVKAEWDEHDNDRTDQMRMGLAVREALGISKWKPEYEDSGARRALQEDGIHAS